MWQKETRERLYLLERRRLRTGRPYRQGRMQPAAVGNPFGLVPVPQARRIPGGRNANDDCQCLSALANPENRPFGRNGAPGEPDPLPACG